MHSFTKSSKHRLSAAAKIVATALTALFAVGAGAADGQYVIGGTEEAPLETDRAPINFQNKAPDIDEPIRVSHVNILKPSSSRSSVVIFNAVQNQDLRFQSATVEHADILYTSSFGANVAGIQVSNGIHDFYTDFLTVDDVAIDLGGTGRANAAGILIQSSTAGQKLEHLKVAGVSTTAGASGGTTSGVRFEVAGLDTALIDVSDVSSDNIGAYGIYNLESTLSSDAVVLSSVSSSNATAYGYYAVNSVWNDAELDTASLRVSDVTGAQYAYGVRLNDTDTTADDKYDQKDHAVSLNASESVVVTGVRVDANSAKAAGAYGVHHKGTDLSTGLLYVSDVSGVQYADGPAAAGFWSLGQTSADAVVIRNVSATNGQAYGILSDSTAGLQSGLIAVENVSASAEAFGYTVGQNTQSDLVSVLGVHSTGSDATSIRILKATLDADTVSAVNVQADEGEAKGIFVDGRNSVLGPTSFITAAGISGSGNAYGLHHANTSAEFVNTDGIFVQDVSSSQGTAYGLHLQNSKTTSHDVFVSDVSGKTAYGVYATGVLDADGELFVGDITGSTTARGLYTTKDSALGALTVSNVSVSDAFGTATGVSHRNAASVSYSGDVVVANVSGTRSAYGLQTDGVESAALNGALTVSGVEADNASGLVSEGGLLTVASTTTVLGILGTDKASAITVENGTADFADVVIAETDAAGTSSLVSAKDNASVSIASGIIRSAALDAPVAYEGNFESAADSEENGITRFALRSVGGSLISMGGESGGRLTVVGDIVAGRGTQSAADAQAGRISVNAAAGSSIYGDVYAGNGGEVSLTLSGSVLEGQIDDYHELTDGTAESSSFRNAAFVDDEGNAVDVTQAGSVSLTLADSSVWYARGQSFVKNLAFAGEGSVVDLSRNDNSSVTIGTLSGSNGVFRMKLGKPEAGEDGLIRSDMLYVGSFEADSQNRIEVVFADGVKSFEDLDGLRFATTGRVDSTEHLQLALDDQGFFNRTLSVELEDYEDGDADNAKYNGASNGEGSYKPGEDAVDGMFASGGTNWFISSKPEEPVDPDPDDPDVPVDPVDPVDPPAQISDAGETILGTARAAYWNAVVLDRFNLRYGERTYDENRRGVWARVKHERLGTDSGTGDFRSYNTSYQFGFDFATPSKHGKTVWGAALDYTDGDTRYRSVTGEGGTDRISLSLYATYLGDNGFYGDLVVRTGKLRSDFEMRTPSGTALDADYDNVFFGVSYEAGRMLENGTGWFVEPQVQMQYMHVSDADWSTAQTRVEQDAVDSLIGRAGFRVGKFLSDDKSQTAYFKADVLREFKGEQKIRVSDVTTRIGGEDVSISNRGTWFDVGAGFQSALSKDFFAYGDVEYRFGNDLWNTWIFNLGAKYRF